MGRIELENEKLLSQIYQCQQQLKQTAKSDQQVNLLKRRLEAMSCEKNFQQVHEKIKEVWAEIL